MNSLWVSFARHARLSSASSQAAAAAGCFGKSGLINRWAGAGRGITTQFPTPPLKERKELLKNDFEYDASGYTKWKYKKPTTLKEVTVVQKNIQTSTKKLNHVMRGIRLLPVPEAMVQLRYAREKISENIMLCIREAAEIAKEDYGLEPDQLNVAILMPGRGTYLKRLDIKGRNRRGMITVPYSRITCVLREIDPDSDLARGKRDRKAKNANRKVRVRHRSLLADVHMVEQMKTMKKPFPSATSDVNNN
uniref:50S ribosomal protein L22, chloroplastic n=1 Tax=Mucochytrium quahogii TaxID=96639 RepID=A0A7S2S7T4_9STRA|mmetsp:Transcript_25388/g.54840  ORF Transcript_25388/g.54840 Transcript_25388/m.54840 type:complete len:249 (+) Transcript_25388:2-748(+)